MVRQQKAMLNELSGLEHLNHDPDTETDIGHSND